MDRYWSTGVDGFDTGLTVYDVVRVGRAVLFTYEYGEGNGSEQTRQSAFARAEKGGRAGGGCDGGAWWDALLFTPEGVTPFRLGMNADEVRQAAPDAVLLERGASCTELTWSRADGLQVFGALDPQTGLVYLSSPQGITIDGIGVGSRLIDLRAAYPDLDRADNGLWFVERGATSYAFAVTAAGRIDDLMVIGDDQHCAS